MLVAIFAFGILIFGLPLSRLLPKTRGSTVLQILVAVCVVGNLAGLMALHWVLERERRLMWLRVERAERRA
jgi:predicted MFS family arabinose efflux permease